MDTPLRQALEAHVEAKRLRCHVPFHAGHSPSGWLEGPLWQYDLTELPGLDVLGNPQDTLLLSQQVVAQVFGAAHSFYLVNGATVGLQAALLALGGTDIALARNCHGSVVNGLVLTGAHPHWILPDYQADWGLWGAVSPQAVEDCLQANPNIKAVVVTHPTYEGLVSDIAAIAQVCRAHQAILIVDEAHGATFALSPHLPSSAIEAGADVVVHSMHKSGGALTQGALIHLPPGSRMTPDRLQAALRVLQTTSPSYPLLASLEAACVHLDSSQGRSALSVRWEEAQTLRAWVNTSYQTLRAYDQGSLGFQIYLRSTKLSGEDLGERLEETFGVSFESVSPYGCLLNWNLGLPQNALATVQKALAQIDKDCEVLPDYLPPLGLFGLPQQVLSPREAFWAPSVIVPPAEAVGQVAAQSVWTCPPGIPIVVPGEKIGPQHLAFLSAPVQVVAPLV